MLELLIAALISVDGDSIKDTTTGAKYRLQYIDCPEKKQAFGNEAAHSLQVMLDNSKITFKIKKKDLYGRSLAEAWSPVFGMLNEVQLRNGLAWQYYDKDPKRAALVKESQRQHWGIWSQTKPVPPWTWRKNRKLK